ncbi:hypothetical protein, partial [Escherichia coli]|uniref:hypothetical protein n=1 Tax=Escherichia coli TaxID=562 RepID=UPI001BB04187
KKKKKKKKNNKIQYMSIIKTKTTRDTGTNDTTKTQSYSNYIVVNPDRAKLFLRVTDWWY